MMRRTMSLRRQTTKKQQDKHKKTNKKKRGLTTPKNFCYFVAVPDADELGLKIDCKEIVGIYTYGKL